MLKLGFSVLLQPTSFQGPQESKSLFSEGGGLFDNLIQDLFRSRQFLSLHYPTEKKDFILCTSWFPRTQGYFRRMLDLHCLNMCIACKTFCMLSIKQLLGLNQLGDWFTTINSEDAYFHVRGQSLSCCAVETVSVVCSFYKNIIVSHTVSILPSVESSNEMIYCS